MRAARAAPDTAAVINPFRVAIRLATATTLAKGRAIAASTSASSVPTFPIRASAKRCAAPHRIARRARSAIRSIQSSAQSVSASPSRPICGPRGCVLQPASGLHPKGLSCDAYFCFPLSSVRLRSLQARVARRPPVADSPSTVELPRAARTWAAEPRATIVRRCVRSSRAPTVRAHRRRPSVRPSA